jgi:XTP/dITP diphosphohydrolase
LDQPESRGYLNFKMKQSRRNRTTIVVATSNQGKFREIKRILAKILAGHFKFVSLRDLSLNPRIIENGRTYLANAVKKAKAVSRISGLISITDDSGIEVDHLKGKPGIHSARFSGKGSNDRKNRKKLLKLLEYVPAKKRKARFVCCAVAYIPQMGKKISAMGKVEGYISNREIGKNGFGYDSLFYYPKLGKTFGEISQSRKNRLSHRGEAFRNLGSKLKNFFR